MAEALRELTYSQAIQEAMAHRDGAPTSASS